MKENYIKTIYSLTIVSIVAIIAIMICCLSAMGFNSKVTIEKEKIEVSSQTTNSIN